MLNRLLLFVVLFVSATIHTFGQGFAYSGHGVPPGPCISGTLGIDHNTGFVYGCGDDSNWHSSGVISPYPYLSALADYKFTEGIGTNVTDYSGHGYNGTLGTSAPTWSPVGLAFDLNQYVTLPAALNSAQTFIFTVYISPIQSGNLGPETNIAIPVLLGTTLNDSGLSLMLAAPRREGDDYLRYAFSTSVFAAGSESTATGEMIAGLHTVAYVLGTVGSSVDHLYIDGVELPYAMAQGSNAGVQSSGNLTLGAAPGTSTWRNTCKGSIYRMRAYASPLTAALVASESSLMTAEVIARGVSSAPSNIITSVPTIHGVGDSITYGVGTSTPYITNLTLDTPLTPINWGIGGMYIQAIAGSDYNRVAPYCKQPTGGPTVVSVFAGTNDFADTRATPASVFSALAAEVAILKGAGCKVFVGTMLSRGGNDGKGQTLDSDKDAYDAIILAQAKSVGADGIVDFAANPQLGADGANSNTTYFNTDLTHPTNAGQALLAATLSNTLNRFFGASSASPKIVTGTYSMKSGDAVVLLQPTASTTITLPSCLGPSGEDYRFLNPQSTYSVTLTGLSSSQTINGSTSSYTIGNNGSTTLRIVPNAKSVGGCGWLVEGSSGSSVATAATPSASPAPGTYSSAQSVTLTSSTSGASIYYTLDGSTPTSSSTLYSGPFTLSSSATLKAIATASGFANSAVYSGQYTISTAPATYASNGCSNSLSSGSSIGCGVSGVTAGQTLLVNVANYAAGAITLTDSSGNAATLLSGYPVTFGGGSNSVYVIKNASAGTHTITASFTSGSSSYPQLMVDVVSGASATSPIDAASSTVQATTSGVYDYSCSAVTTNSANELVISFINTTGGAATGFETTPQQLTAAQEAANSSNVSAYGTFTTAGSNYVRWQVAGGTYSCDTIAIH